MSKDSFSHNHTNQRSGTNDVRTPLTFVPAHASLLTEAEAVTVDDETVLMKVFFGQSQPVEHGFPHATIETIQLQPERLVEVWTSPSPIRKLIHKDIQVAANSDVLFGCARQELPPVGESLETLVQHTYRSLLSLVGELGYPNLIRIWNYIPGIGGNVDGLECYRRFCRARYNALEEMLGEFNESLPATTAVGVTGNELTVMFLAAKREGEQRENPRQVSAYHYPRLYGPRSPSFARATHLPWWGTGALFISGTASIVGHESRHLGNPENQLKEAVENVRVLVESGLEKDGLTHSGFDALSMVRVYLKDPVYFDFARDYVQPLLNDDTRALYLLTDICRNELLVEIEGVLLPQESDQ